MTINDAVSEGGEDPALLFQQINVMFHDILSSPDRVISALSILNSLLEAFNIRILFGSR